jgi:hypothetical protein
MWMVSKDQTIGGLILLICVIIGFLYVLTLFYPQWLSTVGVNTEGDDVKADIRFWVVATPVLFAFVAILAIGAWIGYTMLTTPPPKPIEDLTTEVEEKKEEPPPPEKAEEEKKPERKRKEDKQA